MAKQKLHVTPESARVSVTLGKNQLKMFKIMSIEFEMSQKELLEHAINVMIQKYKSLTSEEIEERGIELIYD